MAIDRARNRFCAQSVSEGQMRTRNAKVTAALLLGPFSVGLPSRKLKLRGKWARRGFAFLHLVRPYFYSTHIAATLDLHGLQDTG
jgi:hypothetical protein